ncbi:DUF3943 domain-containing protein [Treponema sp.]|uniref:DUF3943 domain-containing protein n=1 Tax=Treponema sp. TaxID=166 RepID=UPI0025E48B2D|nr:DUF3943 domain-containing protein [Treponema sp.]MCR5217218.1 DUF3943 domain-containing protein [Treponema sp.]
MKKSLKLFLIIASITAALPAWSQEEVIQSESKSESESSRLTNNFDASSDFFDDDNLFTHHGDRHFLTASTGMFVPTVVLSLWNRYASGSGWAKVDYKRNFNRLKNGTVKWEWDTDWYWTNFVLHPYQGQLSYSAFRTANFSQFESMLAATFGSFVWETMCENNTPSLNDMVYTSVGAWPMGEMLHRLSFEADAAWGPLRFLITPMRLWNEGLTGEKPYGSHGNIKELSFYTGFGAANGVNDADTYDKSRETYPLFGSLGLDIVYGDSFNHNSNDPFSAFNLSIGGSMGKGCGQGYRSLEKDLMHNLYIFSDGWVISRSVLADEDRDTSIGIIFDYDFLWHSFMNFSTLAPGFGIKQRFAGDRAKAEWELHLDAVLLGTHDVWYYRRQVIDSDKIYKAYNYSVGGEAVAALRYKFNDGPAFVLNNHFYAFYDFKDAKHEVEPGLSLFDYLRCEVTFPVSSQISLGGENILYAAWSCFDSYPDVVSLMYSTGFFVRYNLK